MHHPPVRKPLLALAALAATLALGSSAARAQLPPSPADAPPADGVRPTPAPRAAPPPPPDSRVRPTDPPEAVPPEAPPPPAPPAPPSSSKPPMVKPIADKIFGTKGVLELGGNVDFSVLSDQVSKSTWLNLGVDAYVGYFVAKYFTLGLYLSVYFSRVDAGELPSWSVVPGFLLAPGVAARLVSRLFFYGDVLGGVFGRKAVVEGLAPSRDSDVMGRIGAEVGLKLRVTGQFLVRFGLRLYYDVGKATQDDDDQMTSAIKSDIRRVTFLMRLGFSGFL